MFHKEGHRIIIISLLITSCLIVTLEYSINIVELKFLLKLLFLMFFVLILQFFRNPKRKIMANDKSILAPADGKIVIIKEVFEKEFYNEKRLQVSIFMSPFNVHVTRYPVGGEIIFSKYHPGKYLFAWHPKSSELNERTTIVIKNKVFGNILYRQIAGALARRIVNYASEGREIKQGDESGFIKFGSRLDIFLPLKTKVNVSINQTVKGGISEIA
ncbi:MAG: phosphatidylserine decarboxylase family protein [Flavobacteriales bacterium]|nr:MAG: phosphatidylserine decarboxylase family protein [Flavobacteriales bacterium TMED96]RZP11145.1 MAG: phosphatidylserine decarboxylase family protein [Flavobacteriales bacterium]